MQLSLDIKTQLPKDAYEYGTRSSGEVHGLVLTKPHVVDLILDLAGYTAERSLAELRLLEPACGHGVFLVRAVERLLVAAERDGVPPRKLAGAVAAYDIEPDHVAATKTALMDVLLRHAFPLKTAQGLVNGWVHQGDFLLAKIESHFDVVIGNPPYIRIEQLSPALQAEYRARFSTLYDRADLYVAFIERGLRLLSPAGVLSFICADRWTLNRYGAPLRKFITQNFTVRAYIDLHQASPFESEVIAYPSVFVIGREREQSSALVAKLATGSSDECLALRSIRPGTSVTIPGVAVARCANWFRGDEPWVLSSPEHLAVLRTLEERFPLLEGDGKTFVRIGVATGNDSVLIVPTGTDIEEDRLVPLVMRGDIERGKVKNGGRFVINTSRPQGGVVDLNNFPKLARYLEAHRDKLAKRHVAQKSEHGWFRTIDRVYPDLVAKRKLLIPDIAGANEVVYEPGEYYPHHNLYFVISDLWDMEVLGGLLSSRVALFFVWSYAVKMRGGYLRFQAQYLRKIRVPPPQSIPKELADSIREAFRARDFKLLDGLACRAYELPALPDFDFVDTRR